MSFRLAKAGLAERSVEVSLVTHLIGRSDAFTQILDFIDKVASVQAPVLILGETGTGKEVAARAIHYRSPNRTHPFVPFNCGGVPAELLENELFGHEAGAFTSAQKRQAGLVAQAEGGCLFLDEIDALPLQAQAALLRFLQDHRYRPLGSSHLNQAHVRILAASNADLVTRVTEGRFREDLWYRLNVLTLTLPPLRERREDIPLLAEHFLQRFSQIYRRPVRPFSARSLTRLMRYPWPGNVRELENWVHRTVLLGEVQLPGEEEPQSSTGRSFQAKKSEAVARFEREYLTELMHLAHGNVSQAAKIAGKERRCLGKLLKKHGLCAKQFKPS
ncbi:sigma-54 interaction domain-containing protein [Methylothermus subterraneus]